MTNSYLPVEVSSERRCGQQEWEEKRYFTAEKSREATNMEAEKLLVGVRTGIDDASGSGRKLQSISS